MSNTKYYCDSIQRLKAEIRALISNSRVMSTVEFYSYIGNNYERLCELSAVDENILMINDNDNSKILLDK